VFTLPRDFLEGNNLHRELMILAAHYLSRYGYEVTLSPYLKPGNKRVDVLGEKANCKVGIECQSFLPLNTLYYKMLVYGPRLTKLIFAFPRGVIVPNEITPLYLKTVSQGKSYTCYPFIGDEAIEKALELVARNESVVIEDLILEKLHDCTSQPVQHT
jgi:hypothetical protein